jgi:preprotein translocase subunit SecA
MQDTETPLESELLTNTLENAQKKVESFYSDSRKNIFQYDEILNTQRKQIFEARKEFFYKNFFHELIVHGGESFLDQKWEEKEKNIEISGRMEKSFDSYFLHWKEKKSLEKENLYPEIWISVDLRLAESNCYQLGFFQKNRFTNLLEILDFSWTEHLERMSSIRETINWRAYGQQNPFLEYNIEAFKSFDLMLDQIACSMLYYSLNNPIQ